VWEEAPDKREALKEIVNNYPSLVYLKEFGNSVRNDPTGTFPMSHLNSRSKLKSVTDERPFPSHEKSCSIYNDYNSKQMTRRTSRSLISAGGNPTKNDQYYISSSLVQAYINDTMDITGPATQGQGALSRTGNPSHLKMKSDSKFMALRESMQRQISISPDISKQREQKLARRQTSLFAQPTSIFHQDKLTPVRTHNNLFPTHSINEVYGVMKTRSKDTRDHQQQESTQDKTSEGVPLTSY
jgi:hypothetical protein